MPSLHLKMPRGTAKTLDRQRKQVTGRQLWQMAGVSHPLSAPDKVGTKLRAAQAQTPLHTTHT